MCPRQGLKRELVIRQEDQITIRDMEEHRPDNSRTKNWVKDQEIIYRNQMARRNERQNIEKRNLFRNMDRELGEFSRRVRQVQAFEYDDYGRVYKVQGLRSPAFDEIRKIRLQKPFTREEYF